MLFDGLTRRRLASFLRPWLREEPELEVSFGLVNSCAIAKNLGFDASVLNELLDDGTGFRFGDVTVREFIVRFSYWSVPAFSFEVRGVNVTLLARDSRLVRKPNEPLDEAMKKRLSQLDPEGTFLHSILEKISTTTPSGNKFKTGFLNLVLKHCRFEISDLNVLVKCPVLDDSCSCLFSVKEFKVESQYLDFGCLVKGLVASLFVTVKETSHVASARSFEVVLNTVDRGDQVLLSADLFSCIKLIDQKLVDFNLRVPELSISFSPADVFTCLAFSKASSKEYRHVRKGKELWKLAARRVNRAISSPRMKFCNVVVMVGLWLRYVNSYDRLLQLVGYPDDHDLLTRTTTKTAKNEMVSSSIIECWKMISDIEKELPADSVAQARRVARSRVAVNIQSVAFKQSYLGTQVKLITQFFDLLGLFGRLIFKLLGFILCLLTFRWKFVKEPKSEDLEIVSDHQSPNSCFILNLGRILVTISPNSEVQVSEIEKLESDLGIPFSGFVLLSLSVDALLFKYVKGISEESLILSCGKFKVESSSFTETPLMQGSSRKNNRYAKGHWNTDQKFILWCEPGQSFPHPETSDIFIAESAKKTCDPSLENFLGEMWSNWKRTCIEFEKSDILYSENPCLLFESRTFLTYSGLQNSDSGLLKCFFILGKLHLGFGCSTVVSTSVLFRQMQHALCMAGMIEKSNVHLITPRTMVDPPETSWDGMYKYYANNLTLQLLKKLPEKHVRFGVFISSPCIKLSLEKKFICSNKNMDHIAGDDGFHLGFDIGNIEVLTCPNSTPESASHVDNSSCNDADTDCTTLKQLQMIKIPKSENEKYTSDWWNLLGSHIRINGLDAYWGNSAEKPKSQIFVLQPIIVKFSSSREYFHSFSTNDIALSAVLSASAAGTILLYMDELHALSKVAITLHAAVSYVFRSFDSVTSLSSEIFRQKFGSTELENEEETAEEVHSIGGNTLFLVGGIFKIESVDLTLQKRRINDSDGNSTRTSDALRRNSFNEIECPDCGILISLQKASIDVSCEGEKSGISVEVSEIQAVLYECQNKKGKNMDQSINRDLLHQYGDCLYEISLSNAILSFSLFLPQNASCSWKFNDELHGSSSGNNKAPMDWDNQFDGSISRSNTSYLRNTSDSEVNGTSNVVRNLRSASTIPAPDSSHSLLVDVGVGMVYMGSCSLKNALVGASEVNRFLSSLSIGGEFQTMSWEIQGGLLFLETKALEKFTCCFSSYLRSVTNVLLGKQLFGKDVEKSPKTAHNQYSIGIDESLHVRGTVRAPLEAKWERMQALTINVSQLSTVLVTAEKQGGAQELVLEFNASLTYELANGTRNIIFDLKRLSVISQILHQNSRYEFQKPHFYSFISDNKPRKIEAEDDTIAFQPADEIHPINDPSSSRDDREKLSAKNNIPEVFGLASQKHILKQLGASLSVQKHIDGQAWSGSGCITGFDITLSLSDIEMILSIVSFFSGTSSKTTIGDIDKKQRSSNLEESDSSFEAMIPDGSIVGIQDVQQHMFFAVDGEANNYSLAGAIHYSLVGERALFRVKYHIQRRWRSQALLFSLISLHAKNDSGEPYRLSYRPGSGFVDISSTDDGARACWRVLSCEPESVESDVEWETQKQLVRKNFYLVNKKNDCAVAFVDGIPEFVRKPGNLFKFKVFRDYSLVSGLRNIVSLHSDNSGTSVQPSGSLNETTSGQGGTFPFINVVLERISLTIAHELSDSSDVSPLLRVTIDDTRLIVQILSAKTRVICTSMASIYHFDSLRSLWRELLHPVEIFLFYRSNFRVKNSEANIHGIPVHIHGRTKEMNISLSELSLDILLFVVGKLNLAGPYLLKSSRILVNCCKVENQTGMDLLCDFFDKHSVKVARNQSTSIILRYSDLAKQPQESANVSFRLAVLGSFSTSSVHLSLSQSQRIAWKTRITSSLDSRTYPGPFLIVDVSKESEDGLSIVVSPLIRIHNETRFSMELRFRRPQQKEDEFALVELNSGDTIDDSVVMFNAVHFSGGLKKALTSLSLGNFLFSFRPNITEGLVNSMSSLSVSWSGDLKGGKAVRLAGIFDKLGYKVRKALLTEAVKCSFSTVQCSVQSEGSQIDDIYFLIQSIGRDVPVVQPNNSKEGSEYSSSPVTLQDQKEIFLLPTVKVSNLVQSEIHVTLSEKDGCSNIASHNSFNQAVISCGSSADFYVNPSIIYFTVTLTAYNSSCKPVNSSDWVKKLQKQKTEAQFLDIDLDFGGGSCFASMRLFRGHRGMLEATVFTSYALKNDTAFDLYFFAPNQKPIARDELEKYGSSCPPELGLRLPPKSTRSWFLKSNKVRIKQLDDNAKDALLDLAALSGLAEISLEIEESTGVKSITKLGVSMGPPLGKVVVPSQVVTLVPRYVLVNESDEAINVRQCYLQDDTAGITLVNSRQRTALLLWSTMSKIRELSLFERVIRNHGRANDDTLFHIQLRPNESEFGWSGPVCIASIGRFFVKHRNQQSGQVAFAVVHVIEEGSTLVLHFHKPPNVSLPYRIENRLQDMSITYFQKESAEAEILGSESTVGYAWDDFTLPHRLVVRINDSHLLREINLDKVRGWKSFYKLGQHIGLAYHHLLDKNSELKTPNASEYDSLETAKVGYEVYADGPTRVLRICEISRSHQGETLFQSSEKIQLRVPQFTIQLLEQRAEDGNERGSSSYAPIVAARFGNFSLDSLFTDRQKYNQINVQSLIIEQKWIGAPFAAMLRRHQVDSTESNDCILRIVFILLSTTSDVIQVQYASIALQPIDLNVDEETLMRLVPFWRTSLSDPNAKSRQFYFDHFEIQPIKIISNFLPGDSYSSYSSAQETLRSLLHSVIKVPPIKNMNVELNGVLVTHALITMRELFIRCAQHYSWYGMRAIYIAKGSPLLPPDFVSMFDDMASSSLDVFFDPSRGLTNLPGLTLGTFKFISKCIRRKGFSGTKRYFGDLGKSLRTAGSNVLFAAVTEISDSVLKGAEASGLNGMVIGFHHGVMRLAMEPSLLGSALMEGGPDRKIKLDRSPGTDELYIEGYIQAMLDTLYRQEYLRVRVIDNQVHLKNLPPNNTLIEEIVDHVKGFLVSKALLKGDPSRIPHSLRHLRGESEWRLGPTLLTLCEHLFVSFAIRILRKQANKLIANAKWKKGSIDGDDRRAIVPAAQSGAEDKQKVMFIWRWGIGRFVLSGILAYVDGRLCRCIPNPIARRIVSGFLLSFLDQNSDEAK